ncbi:hypothetical protein KUTeg_017241 [Tegillarca granosa]|uniref:Uncharacterized protein n=1 Tax=Tegillarca granosa TaxID=220873 RepID=A0ABQ9EIY9_TEGGR|nr:hypothetical protein KUTeg_017241 [Tegillarca granosa]
MTKYFVSKKETRPLEDIPPEELDTLLAKYFLNDHKFQHSRDVLSAKRKHLKTLGKGNKPYKADELTSEEIDMLYSSGCLGTDICGDYFDVIYESPVRIQNHP